MQAQSTTTQGSKDAPVASYGPIFPVQFVNSHLWRDALTTAAEIPFMTRAVLQTLSFYAHNEHGMNMYPGNAWLSAMTELSERTVRKHLATAMAAGYLHRYEGGKNTPQGNRTAKYRACVPAYRAIKSDAGTGVMVRNFPPYVAVVENAKALRRVENARIEQAKRPKPPVPTDISVRGVGAPVHPKVTVVTPPRSPGTVPTVPSFRLSP